MFPNERNTRADTHVSHLPARDMGQVPPAPNLGVLNLKGQQAAFSEHCDKEKQGMVTMSGVELVLNGHCISPVQATLTRQGPQELRAQLGLSPASPVSHCPHAPLLGGYIYPAMWVTGGQHLCHPGPGQPWRDTSRLSPCSLRLGGNSGPSHRSSPSVRCLTAFHQGPHRGSHRLCEALVRKPMSP